MNIENEIFQASHQFARTFCDKISSNLNTGDNKLNINENTEYVDTEQKNETKIWSSGG